MAVWWCALLVVVIWADTSESVSRREWAGCGPVVCGEVERQAQGLVRLKLLRNYVAQTMELLDSVVESLEDEVVRTGHSLTEFIGDDCTNAHTVLHQVIQEFDDDHTQNLRPLDVLQDTESSQTHSPYTSTSQGTISHTSALHELTSHSTNSQTPSIFQEQSTTRRNEGVNAGRTWTTDSQNSIEDSSTEADQDLVSSSSNVLTFTNKFDQESTEELATTRGYKRGPYRGPTSPHWRENPSRGGTGFGYGGGDLPGRGVGRDESGQGRGQAFGASNSGRYSGSGNRGSNVGNRHRNIGFNHGASDRQNVGGSGGCRGVEPGSEGWIPGLDIWCVNNCALGHCPKNLCLC